MEDQLQPTVNTDFRKDVKIFPFGTILNMVGVTKLDSFKQNGSSFQILKIICHFLGRRTKWSWVVPSHARRCCHRDVHIRVYWNTQRGRLDSQKSRGYHEVLDVYDRAEGRWYLHCLLALSACIRADEWKYYDVVWNKGKLILSGNIVFLYSVNTLVNC